MQNSFIISIHDVTPKYKNIIKYIINILKPIINNQLSICITPNWKNQYLISADKEFISYLKENSTDIILHGYSHYNFNNSIFSKLINYNDEFNINDLYKIKLKLKMGKQIIENTFNQNVNGFISPSWLNGKLNIQELIKYDFKYLINYNSIDFLNKSFAINTYAWDYIKYQLINNLIVANSFIYNYIFRRKIKTIIIHPRDVLNNTFPYIINMIKKINNKKNIISYMDLINE